MGSGSSEREVVCAVMNLTAVDMADSEPETGNRKTTLEVDGSDSLLEEFKVRCESERCFKERQRKM